MIDKPQPLFIVVRKPGYEYDVFPANDEVDNLLSIQEFINGQEASIYRIDFYAHHPNTPREEWLPHTTKVVRVNGNSN